VEEWLIRGLGSRAGDSWALLVHCFVLYMQHARRLIVHVRETDT
jgi:hypothetical protein